MLFRLAYFGVANTLILLRLLPMGDRDKDTEILALRHQIMVLPAFRTRWRFWGMLDGIVAGQGAVACSAERNPLAARL